MGMPDPLITIKAEFQTGIGVDRVTHYEVTCRDCGRLEPLPNGFMGEGQTPQTAVQAGIVRDRHLADHLMAIALEMKESAR